MKTHNTLLILALVAVVALCASCKPEPTPEQRAAYDAEVSRSLIESAHHPETSGSMTGPGNQ